MMEQCNCGHHKITEEQSKVINKQIEKMKELNKIAERIFERYMPIKYFPNGVFLFRTQVKIKEGWLL